MQSPLAVLEMEPGSGELLNCNYYCCEVVGKNSENKVQLWCCMIYVNIKGFSFYFWFPTEKKDEELKRHTLWIGTELKMTSYLHLGEKFTFSLLSPYACLPIAEKNWDFIHLGIKLVFIGQLLHDSLRKWLI